MKKLLQILLVAVSLILTQKVQAGFGNASLSIRTEKEDWITVTIDGTSYPTKTRVFKLNSLIAGNHYVEVVRTDFEPNYHGPATYLVYSGWITLKAAVETRGIITKNNTLKLEEVSSYNPYSNYGNNTTCGTTYNTYGNNYNNGFNNGYSNGYYNGTYSNGYSYPQYNNCYGMNALDFSALKQTIAAQWFESTKITTAKMGLSANYFTADQIRDLLMLFSFESSKVEIAKLAYDRCIDKQNYFKVYDAFSFSSSVDEVSDYVMHH